MTTTHFTGGGKRIHFRIITSPDADIAEDKIVSHGKLQRGGAGHFFTVGNADGHLPRWPLGRGPASKTLRSRSAARRATFHLEN